jgi:hypothetical protein
VRSALAETTQQSERIGTGAGKSGRENHHGAERENAGETERERDVKAGEQTRDELTERTFGDKGQNKEQKEEKEFAAEEKGGGERLGGMMEDKSALSSSLSCSQIAAPILTQTTETSPTSSVFDDQKALLAAQQEVAAWSAGKLKSNVLACLRGDYVRCISLALILSES